MKINFSLAFGLALVSAVGCSGSVNVNQAPVVYGTAAADPSVCPNGGYMVSFGYDTNANGVLDYSEIQNTLNVCNGQNGLNGQNGYTGNQGPQGETGATGAQGPAGANGVSIAFSQTASNDCGLAGGVLVSAGFDTNYDGVLDGDETPTTSFDICNGANGTNGYNVVEASTADDGTYCGDLGGQVITFYLDVDGSGTVSEGDTQVGNPISVCNGQQGVQGEQGVAGQDAAPVLFSSSPATTCGDAGGTTVVMWQDLNGNSAVDDGEPQVQYTTCNGATGATGTSGTNGTDGTNAISSVLFCSGVLNTNTSDHPDNHSVQFVATNFSNGDVYLTAIYDGDATSTYEVAPVDTTPTMVVDDATFTADLTADTATVSHKKDGFSSGASTVSLTCSLH